MSGSCIGLGGGGHVDGQDEDEERGERINGFWYVK